MVMGVIILGKAFQGGNILHAFREFVVKRIRKRILPSDEARGLIPLALAGGFFDALGGGGWGSIVSSSLLAQGTTPHYTIGSVNLTEFILTIAISATFFFSIGVTHWPVILGLIVGGGIAAPFAAYLVRRIQPRIIMLVAGIIIILLSMRAIYIVLI